MATVNQLVRKPRATKRCQEHRSGARSQSAEARRLHACLYNYAEEAKLCNAQGSACSPDQWF